MQQIYLTDLTLIAARFYGAMWICPLFAEGRVPRLLKVLLVICFSMIVLPYLNANLPYKVQSIFFGLLLIEELMTGFILGFIFSLPIWLVENIGNLIDMGRGEQFGSMINPLTKNPTSSISKLLSQGFITYVVSINGILFFIKIIFISFNVFTLGGMFLGKDIFSVEILTKLISLFDQYVYWTVILALPVLLIMVLCEFGFGLFSIFAQQLNVTVIVMPIKSIVGMLVLILYMGLLYHVVVEKFTSELFKWLH